MFDLKIESISDDVTASPYETEAVASRFAQAIETEMADLSFSENIFIALYGDVGVGKTVFVRGFAGVICPDDYVQSPTYAIVNEYKGKYNICHYDMYRIHSEDDLESTAFYDYKHKIILAEWCENIPSALPDSYYRVTIEKTDYNCGRRIKIDKCTRI